MKCFSLKYFVFVFILCLFFIVGCGDMTANNKTRMDDLLNGASLTLLPNALTAPGYFYDTQCLATLTSLAPGPHADLVHESALTSGNYATLSVDTGASVRTECYASAGVLNELVEFGFDTSSLNLSQYSSLTVTWVGSAGVYGSPCDGVSAYVAFSGTGVLSVLDSGGTLVDKPSKRERELEKDLERYKVLLAEAHADREFLKKLDETSRRLKKQDTAVITGLNIDQYRTNVK